MCKSDQFNNFLSWFGPTFIIVAIALVFVSSVVVVATNERVDRHAQVYKITSRGPVDKPDTWYGNHVDMETGWVRFREINTGNQIILHGGFSAEKLSEKQVTDLNIKSVELSNDAR